MDVEGIEQTGYTEEKGRWLVITKKENYGDVFDFICAELEYIEWNIAIEKHLGKPQPLRGNTKAKATIGMYVEVLQGFVNPQEDQGNTQIIKGTP